MPHYNHLFDDAFENRPSEHARPSVPKKDERVANVRQLVSKVCSYQTLDELVSHELPNTGLDADRRITEADVDQIIDSFHKELAYDVSQPLADWFCSRFFRRLKMTHPRSVGELSLGFTTLYHDIALQWVQLFTSYVRGAMRMAENGQVSRMLFVSRDASALLPIALKIKAEGCYAADVDLVHCNRTMFGIPAVFQSSEETQIVKQTHPFGVKGKKLQKLSTVTYLNEQLRRNEGEALAWVESGFYGTLVKKLYDLGLLTPQDFVFFFASSNPNILGYGNCLALTAFLQGFDISSDIPYICADQLEAFPKLNGVEYIKRGSVRARAVDPYYRLSAMAIYWTFYNFAPKNAFHIDPVEELKRIEEIRRRTTSNDTMLPYVLPECIPSWELGEKFLREEFRIGPIKPMYEWWGP